MKKTLLATLSLALVLSSCAYVPYAREAKKKPRQGGLISLKTDHRPEDRQKAEQMMAANCGSIPVNILEEGEVVIGHRSSSSANKSNEMADSGGIQLGGLRLGGGQTPSERTNTVSETTEMKEWQISYECAQQTKRRS